MPGENKLVTRMVELIEKFIKKRHERSEKSLKDSLDPIVNIADFKA